MGTDVRNVEEKPHRTEPGCVRDFNNAPDRYITDAWTNETSVSAGPLRMPHHSMG